MSERLRSLLPLLALCLLAPLLVVALWGDVYADAAYRQFQQARAIAEGQGWDLGGFSPLHTLLLALVERLRLPLPPAAMALGAVGWMVAIVTWFLTGLVLGRPTFSTAAAILLALHPQQGQALGLEPGLVLGLWGLVTWCAVQGRAWAALVTMLILAATQPLALSFVLPLFLYTCIWRRFAPTLIHIAASVAVGAACCTLACVLGRAWNEPRLTVPLWAALALLVAAGFAFLVPRLDRRALHQAIAVLGLVALVLWQGNLLARDWRFRPTDRLVLYGTLGRWLCDQTLPTETVATQQAGLLGYLSRRATVPLPEASQAPVLLAAIDRARPDYCVALNSLAWQGVRSQPWFQERYEEVYQLASPYDAATPLTVFRYTPTPFDDGEIVTATAVFASDAGEQVELAGYRLDSQRVTPDEPLHLTLYWRAVTVIHQPLLLTLRLVDPATDRVWMRVENSAPGGLKTDLWNAGARLDDRYALLPPADMPPGDYVLDVALYQPNGSALPVLANDATAFVLAHVGRPPAISTVPLIPDHPLSVTFGSEIELVGYDVKARVAPGATLRVALYWHALQPVPLNYKVFVHLLGPDDQLLAQDDSKPVGWAYPTTRWQPGETIRDEHLLTVDPAALRGDYWLVAGLYDAATGERPVVYDAAGNEIPERRVMLRQIQVR